MAKKKVKPPPQWVSLVFVALLLAASAAVIIWAPEERFEAWKWVLGLLITGGAGTALPSFMPLIHQLLGQTVEGHDADAGGQQRGTGAAQQQGDDEA